MGVQVRVVAFKIQHKPRGRTFAGVGNLPFDYGGGWATSRLCAPLEALARPVVIAFFIDSPSSRPKTYNCAVGTNEYPGDAHRTHW